MVMSGCVGWGFVMEMLHCEIFVYEKFNCKIFLYKF